MQMHSPSDLDRLGDEIALLSAHLDAATARLLDMIREFDARGGWNSGFRSCAAWLSWRVGRDLGAARERVRVARALETLPLLLALLCRRHHRAVHEEGYEVARGPDGALRFRRPDGRPLPEVPPPAAVPADPVTALRACHDSHGLRLNGRAACPGWLGERLDLTWAIDVLHPLAQGAPPWGTDQLQAG
jgi:hypothetical protein